MFCSFIFSCLVVRSIGFRNALASIWGLGRPCLALVPGSFGFRGRWNTRDTVRQTRPPRSRLWLVDRMSIDPCLLRLNSPAWDCCKRDANVLSVDRLLVLFVWLLATTWPDHSGDIWVWVVRAPRPPRAGDNSAHLRQVEAVVMWVDYKPVDDGFIIIITIIIWICIYDVKAWISCVRTADWNEGEWSSHL